MPNRRQQRSEEQDRQQQQLIDKVFEDNNLKPRIVTLTIEPFGIFGIKFPSLEQLAEEFVRKNNLDLRDVTDYNFPIVGAMNEPRAYNSGLILQFNQGVAVLSMKGYLFRAGELEPTFGGRPVQSWKRDYVMSGIINGQDAELATTISYSRRTEQQEREHELLHYKFFVDVPIGEVIKNIYRRDNSPLWFVKEQDKD